MSSFSAPSSFILAKARAEQCFTATAAQTTRKTTTSMLALASSQKKVDTYLKDKRVLLLVATNTRVAALRKKLFCKTIANSVITGNFDAPQPEQALSAELERLTHRTISQRLEDTPTFQYQTQPLE